MKKKLHWTQTPAGRRTMAEIVRKRRREGGFKPGGGSKPQRRSLARVELMQLANHGAVRRLTEIDAEAQRLRMFLEGLS